MTLDILICTLNKGIVRIEDVISAPRPNVNYIIAYQYTDERYLELIPQSLTSRTDVQLFPHKGQGLSSNRNYALERATADLVLFSDDDSRLTEDAFEIIFSRFSMANCSRNIPNSRAKSQRFHPTILFRPSRWCAAERRYKASCASTTALVSALSF
mgnify:CR=1 FL=1